MNSKKQMTEAQYIKEMEKQQAERTERLRKAVQETELKARHWRSQVEIIQYSLEYEEMLPEYKLHLERMKILEEKEEAERMEKQKKMIEEMQEQMKLQAEGVTQEEEVKDEA